MSENIHVLMIEDNPADAAAITKELRGARSVVFHVEHAATLAEGLGRLASSHVDVVLLDLGLPGGEAEGTLQRVTEQAPSLPIVVLTASDDNAVAVRAINEGDLDYVVKGAVGERVLTQAIRFAMHRKRAELASREALEAARESERRLRESEEKFRVVAENARAIFGVIQGNHFVYANAYLAEMAGYSAAELLELDFSKLIHPAFRSMVVDRARRRLMGESLPSHYEFIMLTRTGEERWLDFSVGPIMLHGRPALVGAAFDITERKRAEAALAASELRFRTLFEKMDEAFCVVKLLYDSEGKPVDYRFVEINPAFERHTGFQSARGKTIREFVPDIDPYWVETCEGVARTGKAVRFERALPAIHRFYDVSAFRIGEANSPRVALLFEDITDKKRAAARLAQTTAELARSNQDLEQFANVASHDLQEPLRIVTGFLKSLQEQYAPQLDDKAREYIGFAVDGAERMSQLIRDLLAFSRIGRGGEGFVETDMEAVLAGVIGSLRAVIEEAQATITHDPLPPVKADRSLMSQLLSNLIGNAVKYRAEGVRPQIHVGFEREERGCVFWVKDNGIGIRKEDQDRAFMIFQRLHTRQEYPGTGIGLAICKRIVEHHCGRIWVESEVGQGSTFYFTIPDRP